MKPNFSFSFFHFQKSLKLISMCNLVPPRRLFLFFDKYIVTWEKFKKVKIRFWGPSWTCESSLCEVVKLWVVSKCVFISVENFQFWWLMVGGLKTCFTVKVLSSSSFGIHCEHIWKRFGEFHGCLIRISQELTVFMDLWWCRYWWTAEAKIEAFITEHWMK